ncbi:hypothetical protein TREMEDRAFT_73179 [Tremella mesenterica DSM 1558]|uniref:uncharacterized protein n=1 Tax=Tremella mesenterica (strain ATCC 24925 / CBS 8224 / DSM 1558 / NBRC 9311 / NRRL Y-6157 / RJB 2259-6 / UBC 559-6) TaxID=578456 RepID=UPI0003F494E7|nr:uncharacterized protein TREMEDRAFT_73179 [Tremella mesenterica DSM 1558]EIW71071.1 hypothetical protein TREMEDRAFT_73179 [Tremella mesenterica DSM 1558]
MSTMVFSQTDDPHRYYEDPTISPTSALFPDLSVPYGDTNTIFSHNLNVENRRSFSVASDGAPMSFLSSDSRLPSLSPSSAPLPISASSNGQSPHSSASPSSSFSFGGGGVGEFLLGSNFTESELDMLLYPQGNQQAKDGLFLPGHRATNSEGTDDFVFPQMQGVGQDIGMLNLNGFTLPPQQPQLQTIQPSWVQHLKTPMFKPNSFLTPQHQMNPADDMSFDENPRPISLRRSTIKPQKQTQTSATQKAPPISRRVTPPKPVEAEALPVGKHNKTERRYRQKVQAAQAELRDSVPALRVLYGTSSEEQRRTTDIRAPDGSVDGLGEITRPNASAKATIFIGARMYIELLQQRVGTLQRKVEELEEYRRAVGGEDDFQNWSNQFDALEAERLASLQVKAESPDGSYDFDEEDEEEEEEPAKKPKTTKRKRNAENGARVFAAFAMSFSLLPSASTVFNPTTASQMGVSNDTSATTSQVLARIPLITAEHATRLLARGLPVSIVPSPSTLVDWTWRLLVAIVVFVLVGPVLRRFRKQEIQHEGHESGVGTFGGIIKDACRLIISGYSSQEDDEAASSMWNTLAASIIGNTIYPSTWVKLHMILHLNLTASSPYSMTLLALCQPNVPFLRTPAKIWQQARTLKDITPALAAVLALPLEEAIDSLSLSPSTSTPISAIAEQVALVHLNDLYSRLFIHLVDHSTHHPTTAPISLSTLRAKLQFDDLGRKLRSSTFDKEMRNVINTIPKGSASHALGLVLIGLWGIFTGPAPESQAALASALAGEEIQGAGTQLSSVSAMLDLLYPGSSDHLPQIDQTLNMTIPRNALAIDKLAMVCIDYIRLLLSSTEINDESMTRLQRLEASNKVHKATSSLRMLLTQTEFVGIESRLERENKLVEGDGESTSGSDVLSDSVMDDESEGSEMGREDCVGLNQAKERLVGVLCILGRRAARRATGRDEDSGLEGDLDEL